MTTTIKSVAMDARNLLPQEQIVDAGYVTAEALVESQKEHEVTLLGPVSIDPSWQARAQTGYEVALFVLDWEKQIATCPRGHPSVSWRPGQHAHAPGIVTIKFALDDCRTCPARLQCTQSASGPRELRVRRKEYHEALQAARQRQTTDAFKAETPNVLALKAP